MMRALTLSVTINTPTSATSSVSSPLLLHNTRGQRGSDAALMAKEPWTAVTLSIIQETEQQYIPDGLNKLLSLKEGLKSC